MHTFITHINLLLNEFNSNESNALFISSKMNLYLSRLDSLAQLTGFKAFSIKLYIFVDWRYIYENYGKEIAVNNGFLNSFCDFLDEYVIKLIKTKYNYDVSKDLR